ncbi:hypothetical protein D3C85_939660 [compost metagenome]
MGSTSYITTRNGSISQHVEYIDFGEVLFDEHSSSFSPPYLFNGRELDGETNLSYYGARYLDMKTSLWLSVDPLAEKGPYISGYVYCFNNPLMFSDPSGLWPVYNEKGEYIGDDGRREKGKDLAFTGEKDGKGGFKNLKQFTDNHTGFKKAANVIKHESGGGEKEGLWLAHTANNAQKDSSVNWKKNKNEDVFEQLMDQDYSTTPIEARNPLSTKDNSNNAKNARAGLINVLSGGADPQEELFYGTVLIFYTMVLILISLMSTAMLE